MKFTLTERRRYTLIFLLCWISYFSTYIGRQNYSAVMAEIIQKEGFLNSTSGLVGTGFFICYGVGQIASGFLGDRWNPKYMIFGGVLVSALINFTMGFLHSPQSMIAAWCINGAAQSMTWSPLLRIFSERLPKEEQKAACVNIATTYPAAVFLTYPLCSALIYLSGWRVVFYISGIFMFLVSILWIWGFTYLEKLSPVIQNAPVNDLLPGDPSQKFHFTSFLVILLMLIGCLLAIQGALRDGVTSWVPSYLTNTYHVGTFVAIFATTFLPFINLFGVYFASLIYRKLKKDELQTSSILFAIAFFSIICLILVEGVSLFLSLFFFSIITSCMMGINVMLVSFVPTYFIRFGKVSTVSGLLNSTVYIGSSISTYALGAIADSFGWSLLLKFLCIITVLAFLVSLPAGRRWKLFLHEGGNESTGMV